MTNFNRKYSILKKELQLLIAFHFIEQLAINWLAIELLLAMKNGLQAL